MEVLETLLEGSQEMLKMVEKLGSITEDLTEETLPKYGPLLGEVAKFVADKAINHLANEEAAFFPVLGAALGKNDLIPALLKEHGEIYQAFNSFVRGVEEKSAPDIAAAVVKIVRLLPPHLKREANELYPQAKEKLKKEDWEEIKKKLRA